VDLTVVKAARRRCAHGGGGAHVVNPVVVEEKVGDSPAWTQWQSGRWSVRTRWLWRRSRSGRTRGWQRNEE
jgi:hypothetical protein